MHDALEEEKKSLNKRRTYFHEKERSLKKRQADYKQAHQQLTSHRGRKVSTCASYGVSGRRVALMLFLPSFYLQQQLHNEGNVTLMAEIQSKLDQVCVHVLCVHVHVWHVSV